MRKASGNRALLQVVLQNPIDPLVMGPRTRIRVVTTSQDCKDFLDYALRNYLIDHLPSDSLFRQWLEIIQLDISMPFRELGHFYGGKRFDVYSALGSFKKANPDTMPGCFAEYMFLFDNLS